MPREMTLADMDRMELSDMTRDQIKQLNLLQNEGRWHAFTCPRRGDNQHRKFNGDMGALVATVRGWECPWCDYKQSWAYAYMCDPSA